MKMKYILAISVLVLFSVSTHASKVKEGKNGIYFQKASGSLVYIVDTITKQCYVGLSSVGGVTSVGVTWTVIVRGEALFSCSNLRRMIQQGF